MANNQTKWGAIEQKANQYVKAETEEIKEEIFNDIFSSMKGYVVISAVRATKRAHDFGLSVPKEEFISSFNMAIWQAIRAFDPEKGRLQSIIGRRFNIEEANIWRGYRFRDDSKAGGYSYDKGRCDSLDGIPADDEDSSPIMNFIPSDDEPFDDVVVSKVDIMRSLEEFRKKNERYAQIIRLLIDGYENKDLAEQLGEQEYSSRIRKLVQRSRASFREFRESNVG